MLQNDVGLEIRECVVVIFVSVKPRLRERMPDCGVRDIQLTAEHPLGSKNETKMFTTSVAVPGGTTFPEGRYNKLYVPEMRDHCKERRVPGRAKHARFF